MKHRSGLRRGMEQLRRGLLEASRQAGSSRNGRIDVAVRENIVVTRNSGQPGSRTHASSTQYAPIVQHGGGSSGPAGNSSEEHS